jgi:hypothetical protein
MGLGMGYSDVLRRTKRILGNPGHPEAKMNLVNSLRNQCRLAEGEKALCELDKELSENLQNSAALTGAGNKQTGICMRFNCENRDKSCRDCIREDKLVINVPAHH